MASLVPKRKNKEQAINEKCLATSSSLVSTSTVLLIHENDTNGAARGRRKTLKSKDSCETC